MHDTTHLPTFELPSPTYSATDTATAAPMRTLQLNFPQIHLYPRHIPKWRGAVIESVGRDLDIFHNHQPEGSEILYRPALVHYRCKQGHAILWGMNEGADALLQWLGQTHETICLDGRDYPLNPVEIQRNRQPLQIGEGWRYYRIHDYLALNTENYDKWLKEHSLIKRAALLEAALTAHLLAFCQGAGWWLSQRLEVELVEIHQYKKTRYHNTDLVAFELTYRCNLALPDEVALGKATSHGFGVQRVAPRFA